MGAQTNYAEYTRKMLTLVERGVDFEVDARFIDVLVPRRARILDIGCGIGNAVAALRSRGHQAFGIDPTPELFLAATALHDASWFRQINAGALFDPKLSEAGLPERFDVVLASGNVPEFLTETELQIVFDFARQRLTNFGSLVIGTSSAAPHGTAYLDELAQSHGLHVQQRFSDWHLNPFTPESPWSVSVYTVKNLRGPFEAPDGIFVLPA
ncbi:hypothetical protein AUR04nite_24210 [Glutamicibacter uratoxydans]|uniref:Methyltransferase type 12 domain-containing protein n=1 Tax=Glutamicibacter uratoxydans TaxID=43667 RepID=A0A4Y4DNK3_GLUUR|nr:class I SAM-dependent methyltransferase [Glutamicibacter uratoxydans]GED06889.1 hypothetical protein AUR04nite_24210 [Glutamicibacter uratoxydans]